MTPHRTNKRGTLILDRQFRGVGRIKRASGTRDAKLFRLLDTMLTMLYQAGRIDVLQAIYSGWLTPLEVYSRYRLGELDRLPTVETMKALAPELEAWVKNSKTGRWNRAARKYAVAAILRLAKKDATVQDLPVLLRRFAAKAKGPAMFNRTRAALQAYVRDEIGDAHPIYAKLKQIKTQPEAKRKGNPQRPGQLAALTATMEPTLAEIAWSMALTGMGPGELWGVWSVKPDRIHISGTKREGRVRDIPLVQAIGRPLRPYRPFLKALSEASEGQVRPYDLRKTFANWMEGAKIPRTRRRLYMGHGKADVTDLYERHEVEQYLVEDGERLRAFLGKLPLKAGLKLA